MSSLLKFTLDLLGLEPQVPAAPPASPNRPISKRKKALAPADIALLAPDVIAHQVGPSAEAVDCALAPVQFRHPSANREAYLSGAVVAYAFIRSKRRSIGFTVGTHGLVVSAPKWVPLAEVDAAVRNKGGWIVQKLGQFQERQAQQQATQIVWQNGATFPYLGQPLTLVLEPALHRAHKGALRIETTLRLGLPSDARPAQIRAAVHKWLLLQARALFLERLQHFAPQLGVQWKRLALSNARTRWGSASSIGSIRLNWRLVHHRMAVVDYVVVHELSHLRFMDHSDRFWDTVASILPGYVPLRAELRSVAVPKWDDPAQSVVPG
ncbi:MAG: M48 family metallopeptidase [Ferruginibacter sp.]|nr:M48 family metallopeptidase [Rhodoferax sp.]